MKLKSSSPDNPHPWSPTRMGYRLPAEWEPHAASWLSWPHRSESWPCGMNPIYDFYGRLICAIAEDEPVHVNVNDTEMESLARKHIVTAANNNSALDRISFHHIRTNDVWCRDYCATTVIRSDRNQHFPQRVAIDWVFNAWGEKYQPFSDDNAVARKMANVMQTPCIAGGMVFEGGAVDTNGEGTVMLTESSLLANSRNPGMDRASIEDRLTSMLGAHQFIWLSRGIAGDKTDGHVNVVARFVGPNTIVAAIENNSADINFSVLRDNFSRIRSQPSGLPMEVIPLPMPRPVYLGEERMPASYVNFYITNRSVLVPQFRQETDRIARDTLAPLFPGRRIVGIDCLDLITGRTGIQRLVQHIPAA